VNQRGGRASSRRLNSELLSPVNFLILVLQLVQLPVDTTLREKFAVRAGFPQLGLVHDENPIGPLDRGESVRDYH
jgi:hypothetical protein